MDSSLFVIQFINGLSFAMLLFLITSGLTIIFGVLRILNFAHGSIYMLGAYISYSLTTHFSGILGSFWASLIIAPLIVAIVGGIIEYFFIRPVYKIDVVYQIILTYAFVLILDDTVRMVWGPNILSAPSLGFLSKGITLWGITTPIYFIFVILVGCAVATFLYLLLYKTKFGKVVRAAALDREMIEALGTDIKKLYTIVFCLGCFLAGLGGALDSPIRALTPVLGGEMLVPAFVVVVVGGAGSLGGAVLASIILGEVTSFGILVLPRYAMVFMYVFMAIVLLIKPRGLLGKIEFEI